MAYSYWVLLSQYSRVILVFSDSLDFSLSFILFFCLYQWWQVYLFLDYFFNCPPLKEGQNGMVERDGACISGYPLKLSNACVLLISTWYRSFYFWSTILMQTKVLSLNHRCKCWLGNQIFVHDYSNQMQKDSLLMSLN